MENDLKDLHEKMHSTFDQFKKANDLAQEELKKSGEERGQSKEKIQKMNDRLDELETKMNRSIKKYDEKGGDEPEFTAKKSYAKFLRRGEKHLSKEESEAMDNAWYKKGMTPGGLKTLIVSDDTLGGVLAPEDSLREMLKEVIEFSPIRSIARVESTTMRAVPWPVRKGVFTAQWIEETGTKAETKGLTFGRELIHTHELYAQVNLSDIMIEDSMFNIENFVREEFAEQFGVAEGTAFVKGTASGQPEGFMTNPDVAETITGDASIIKPDSLFTIQEDLKEFYNGNASWVMKRQTRGVVRKLKDGDDQYLWQPGLKDGVPATLLGRPVIESKDMDLEAAGKFPIAYGDFRRGYIILDRIVMTVLRDPFTSAKQGFVELIARKRVGGQVVIAEAIRKLKVSA